MGLRLTIAGILRQYDFAKVKTLGRASCGRGGLRSCRRRVEIERLLYNSEARASHHVLEVRGVGRRDGKGDEDC